MKIEFAWLAGQRPLPVPDDDIVREGATPCRVLLFHGLTGTPTEFGYVAHFLDRKAGLSVECRRLANHGQPLGILARTSWQELYRSARENFLTASETARARGEPLIIGGLSLGGILALKLAADFPDRVDGVMCLSPTLFYDGWNVPWTQRFIRLADYLPIKYFVYLREASPYGLKNEALRQRVAEVYANVSARDAAQGGDLGYAHFPLRLFCEMRHLIANCIRDLPKVKAPLLLLQAEHDDLTSPRNAQFIYDRVASPQKALKLLKNSYHVISVDLDRTVVANAMMSFCLDITQRLGGLGERAAGASIA